METYCYHCESLVASIKSDFSRFSAQNLNYSVITRRYVAKNRCCRYSLASNHLKSLISPHAAALSTPLASNSSISEQKRYVSEVCSNCRVLQRQLNVVTRVIERVKNYFSSSSSATPNISNTSEGNLCICNCENVHNMSSIKGNNVQTVHSALYEDRFHALD